MERSVAITGTRSIGDAPDEKLAEVFEAYLGPFTGADTHFYVGGASGVDTAALQWLAAHSGSAHSGSAHSGSAHSGSALTVVVPCRLLDQPPGSVEVIDRLVADGRLTVVEMGATLLGKAAYHARNRWMVDHAGLVIGFPRGDESAGGGTWYTLNYAAEQGKARLVVPL